MCTAQFDSDISKKIDSYFGKWSEKVNINGT